MCLKAHIHIISLVLRDHRRAQSLISVPAADFFVTTHSEFRLPLLWWALGWGLIGLVAYLSLVSMPPVNMEFDSSDKVGHLLAYGALMGWFGQLYVTLRRQAIMAAGFCAMGVMLEFLQGWGGSRMFDPADMLANTAGVALGWWLTRGWFAGILFRLDRALTR
jgi:hypothetical protein